MKYRVYGHTNVTVTTVVEADSEEEAYEAANDKLCCLVAYCGNGGMDKLVGVDDEDDSVSADEGIEYDDIELIDDEDD